MRLVAQAILVATLAFTEACGAGNATGVLPTDANVVGVYNLTLVNGGPLPFPYSATAVSRIDIVGGAITLTASHMFTDALARREMVFASGSQRNLADTLQGTWSLESHNLTLTYSGLGVQAANVTGNLLTINAQGLMLRYDK